MRIDEDDMLAKCSPLYNLRILRSDGNVAEGWKAGYMNCLQTEAKVAKNQSDDQAECMTNTRRDLRWMKVGTES